MRPATQRRSALHAVLTDVQFWVPALVLIAGILLLIALH